MWQTATAVFPVMFSIMSTQSARLRLLLFLLVVFSLLAAMWAGFLRLGWPLPVLQPLLPTLHGPLMVSGFLGTLISLERAVALDKKVFYLAPALAGLGSAWLIIGLPLVPGQLFIFLGSVGLTAVSLTIIRRHKASYTIIMGAGSVCWLAGNGLWLAGWPIYRFVLYWVGFVILTIVGERLELNRVLRLRQFSLGWFLTAVIIFSSGLVVSLFWLDIGARMTAVGIILLALWLFRYDLARRNVRKSGLTRFIAVNLLASYGWLLLGGTVGLAWGQLTAGPHYDLWLHALFLGFTFGMIFAHALIILPAITGIPVNYHPVFYLPVILLQFSLIVRVVGDLTGHQLRQWGGLLNGIAILLFFAMMGGNLLYSRRSRPSPKKENTNRESTIH